MAKPVALLPDQAPNHKMSCSSSTSAIDWRNKSPLLDLRIFGATGLPNDIQHYNLNTICQQHSGKDEEILKDYVSMRFFDEIQVHEFDILCDKEVQHFKELSNFTTSNRIRPDLQITTKETNFPLLFVEVVSGGNYPNTVSKLTANLVDQLRFLRNYCDVSSLFGYIFPNSKTASSVAKVYVEWKDVYFHARYEYLRSNSVFDDFLLQCIHLSKALKIDYHPPRYFVRISDTDLTNIQQAVGSTNLTLKQCVSKFSILIKDDNFYYKILPQANEDSTMSYMNGIWNRMLIESFKFVISGASKLDYSHIVFPETVFIFGSISIWRFPAQHFQPLTKSEAKECLGDLIESVCSALEEFHQFGYAHCDVRLPNICFTLNGEVKLIDLDRATHVTRHYPSHNPMKHSKVGIEDVPAKEHDFRMLGLMICSVFDEKWDRNTLIELEWLDSFDISGFVKELILGRVVKCSLREEFVKNNPGKVCDVLSLRTNIDA